MEPRRDSCRPSQSYQERPSWNFAQHGSLVVVVLRRQRLPKPSLAIEPAMLAALEHATRYAKIWHDIGTDEAASRATELLAMRGVI
jgi:hypothetical protein